MAPKGSNRVQRLKRHFGIDYFDDFRRWNHVVEFIRNGEMPPEDEPQPTLEERNGVVAALETILMGGKVYVHCAYGRHRGVAMGACVLIALGYEPDAAMQLIAERRAVADPDAFYIRPRIMQFAREWNSK